jgi:hypothetical protein
VNPSFFLLLSNLLHALSETLTHKIYQKKSNRLEPQDKKLFVVDIIIKDFNWEYLWRAVISLGR